MTLLIATLFVILSPGVLFSLPTYATPLTRAALHSVIFVVLYNIIYTITNEITEQFTDTNTNTNTDKKINPEDVIGPSQIEVSDQSIRPTVKPEVSDDVKCVAAKKLAEETSAKYKQNPSPINKRLMDMANTAIADHC